jgi:uncharacterized protein YkwD
MFFAPDSPVEAVMNRYVFPPILAVMLAAAPSARTEDKEFKFTKEEETVLKLTNELRKKEDLPALKPNALLTKAARAHSANMAKQGKLEHVLDEKNPADRVAAAGYKRALVGENVAAGKRMPPKGAYDLWLDSPPHKKNMLSDKFEEIGIGIARDAKGDVYYTQVFGTPRKTGPGGKGNEDADFQKARLEILKLTNAARAKEKREPLKLNDTLTKIANGHSANMARQEKMEHVLDGKKPAQRVEEGGYDYAECGENIAYWSELSVPEVFDAWMKSKTHRDNILAEGFREIGIGLARSAKGDVYFTQVFGTPQK